MHAIIKCEFNLDFNMSAPKLPFFFASHDAGVSTANKASGNGIAAPCRDSAEVRAKSEAFFSGLERSIQGLAMATSGSQQDSAKELITGLVAARHGVFGIGSCTEPKPVNDEACFREPPQINF
jgi:hypothetical protein